MRIINGVVLFSLMTAANAVAQQADKPMAQNTTPAQFQKNPGLPDCLSLAVERGDPSKEASILLVKGTKGCMAPWHFHSPNEQLMVSGTCLGGPCSFFLHADAPFDIHYVDKDGNEIPADQALNKQHKAR